MGADLGKIWKEWGGIGVLLGESFGNGHVGLLGE